MCRFFPYEKSCFYYIPHNVKYHIIYQWSPPQKSLKRLSSTFSIKLEELKALLLMSSQSVDFFVVKLFKVKCHVSDWWILTCIHSPKDPPESKVQTTTMYPVLYPQKSKKEVLYVGKFKFSSCSFVVPPIFIVDEQPCNVRKCNVPVTFWQSTIWHDALGLF